MITENEFKNLSISFGIPVASIKAIQLVESSGSGFDKKTGKIKIQFEPSWFKRLTRLFIKNGVEGQEAEWLAFNKAFEKNPNKAMESTSWGCMQVMGLHWKRLGFESVGSMVDFAKKSEKNQLWLGLRFIATDVRIFRALKTKDWATFANYYNGPKYKEKGYHIKLRNAELNFRVL